LKDEIAQGIAYLILGIGAVLTGWIIGSMPFVVYDVLQTPKVQALISQTPGGFLIVPITITALILTTALFIAVPFINRLLTRE